MLKLSSYLLAELLHLYSKVAMAIYHIDAKTRGNESILIRSRPRQAMQWYSFP
jgi:hypothetical protein